MVAGLLVVALYKEDTVVEVNFRMKTCTPKQEKCSFTRLIKFRGWEDVSAKTYSIVLPIGKVWRGQYHFCKFCSKLL